MSDIEGQGVEEAAMQAAFDQELERRIANGICFSCEAPGAREVSFMRVMSFLVFTHHQNYDAFLCPDCITKTGVKEQAISSFLGWWGFPWGFMTFGAVFINAKSLLKGTMVGAVAGFALPAALLGLLYWTVTSVGSHKPARSLTSEQVTEDAANAFQRSNDLRRWGKLPEARRQLELARKSDPKSWIITFNLAQVCLELGDVPAARRHASRAAQLQPSSKDAVALAAHIDDQCGDLQGARRRLQELLLLDDDVEHHLWYQRVSTDLDGDAAKEMREEYHHRLEGAPESGVARYLFGRLHDDPEERVAALRSACEIEPELGLARGELAALLLTLGEVEEAAEVATGLETNHRALPVGALLSAQIAFERGDPTLALQKIVEVERAGHTDGALLYQKSNILRLLEKWEEADELLSLFLDDAPPGSWLHLERIRLLAEKGSLDAAVEAYREFERHLPTDGSAVRVGASLTGGAALWARGNVLDALKVLEECTPCDEAPEGSLRSRLWTAELLFLTDDAKAGRQVLESIAASPLADAEHSCRAVVATARLLLGSIDPEAYREVAERMSVTYRNNMWFHLGLCHEIAGRKAEAREAYEKSVTTTLGGNFPVVQARHGLKRLEPLPVAGGQRDDE